VPYCRCCLSAIRLFKTRRRPGHQRVRQSRRASCPLRRSSPYGRRRPRAKNPGCRGFLCERVILVIETAIQYCDVHSTGRIGTLQFFEHVAGFFWSSHLVESAGEQHPVQLLGMSDNGFIIPLENCEQSFENLYSKGIRCNMLRPVDLLPGCVSSFLNAPGRVNDDMKCCNCVLPHVPR